MVATGALRIVFFGTPAFAVPALDALLASRHTVVGVVTQPDRPKGRGQKTTAGPVKERALEAGLPVLQPDRMKDPAFLFDGERSTLEFDPLTGEEMEWILQRAYATPKALVQRAAKFNGSGGP